MKVFSAFTGVGGFELGLPPDWKVIGQSEVDKNANKVLRYRFPKVKNYGDIEKIDYREIPDFDVLVGGSPCQDLSLAGKRKGLVGSKSRLFYSYVSILKEKHPRYFIFENVAGLLSSNQGWDFAEVASQFSEAGYDVWWQVLDAKDFGIPQHRERIFVLGSLGEGSIGKVLLEPRKSEADNGIRGQASDTVGSRYSQNQAIGTHIVSKSLIGTYRSKEMDDGNFIVEGKFDAQKEIENIHFSRRQINRVYGTGGIAPTIHKKTGGEQVLKIAVPVRDITGMNAHANGRRFKTDNEPSFTIQTATHQGLFNGSRIRYLTPLECERLMNWPDNWTRWGIDEKGEVVELSDNARYNLIGNGVVPQVVRAVVDKIMPDDNPDATIAMMEAAY